MSEPPMVLTCGVCGHQGEDGTTYNHDCYWVFRERGKMARELKGPAGGARGDATTQSPQSTGSPAPVVAEVRHTESCAVRIHGGSVGWLEGDEKYCTCGAGERWVVEQQREAMKNQLPIPVAEVRRAPMRPFRDEFAEETQRLNQLEAEVVRLTAERDDWELSFEASNEHCGKLQADLEALRTSLRGLESGALLMQQMSGEFVKAIPVSELARLLTTPEEPGT